MTLFVQTHLNGRSSSATWSTNIQSVRSCRIRTVPRDDVRTRICIFKKKKIDASAGTVEHHRRVGLVKIWNEGRGKHLRRMYYGVERSASGTMFLAEISHPHGRLLPLGTFKSDHLAAIAYDQAAIQIYGPNTPLNFPLPPANNDNN
ncbi:putative transcription factor AP2-EREBP family [Helianthus anomalus]